MPVCLRRVGLPVFVWRNPDPSWRLWAYQAAREATSARGVSAVSVTFEPTCCDARGRWQTNTYWPTVEYVIDGLVASGVITDRACITRLVLLPSKVAGVDGCEVTVDNA